jgi:formiminotetrahydrofolate cyclodeaminase
MFIYFNDEGFFSSATFSGDVNLSHRAIVEIENSINNPQKPTEHFSSTVIQNFRAPVGAVQTGNQTVANVNQNIGQSFSEILEQLANLKREFQSLPDGDREEAIEVVDALAIEVQSENPSKGKVKAFLSSVKDFAVKTGTDVTSKIVVELIKSQIGSS